MGAHASDTVSITAAGAVAPEADHADPQPPLDRHSHYDVPHLRHAQVERWAGPIRVPELCRSPASSSGAQRVTCGPTPALGRSQLR